LIGLNETNDKVNGVNLHPKNKFFFFRAVISRKIYNFAPNYNTFDEKSHTFFTVDWGLAAHGRSIALLRV
jgi:hypothetical protein